MHGHIGILSMRSSQFRQIFKESLSKRKNKDEKIIVDFEGKVLYSAFKKIVDYLYLDDLKILDSIIDFSEMMEVTKFAKLHKLESLFKAAEVHFQEVMLNWFQTSSVFSIKTESLSNRGCSGTYQVKNEEISQVVSGQGNRTSNIVQNTENMQVQSFNNRG